MTDEFIQHNRHGFKTDIEAINWLTTKAPDREVRKVIDGFNRNYNYSVWYVEDGISYAFNAFVGD